MLTPKTTAAVLAFLTALDGVTAGAGANVWACVNYEVQPSQPFNVHFSPIDGENKCMNNVGNDADVSVSSSGLTCASIGYVESKASSTGGDTCATSDSIWHIAYNTSGTGSDKSGSMKSLWWYSIFSDDEIDLSTYPKGSRLCGSQHMCDETNVTWASGVGTAYFIFQPDVPDAVGVMSESKETDTQVVMGEL